MSFNAVQVWQHVVAADNVENGASHAQTGVVHIKEKGTELIGRQQVVGAARCGNQRVLFQLVLRGMDRLELPSISEGSGNTLGPLNARMKSSRLTMASSEPAVPPASALRDPILSNASAHETSFFSDFFLFFHVILGQPPPKSMEPDTQDPPWTIRPGAAPRAVAGQVLVGVTSLGGIWGGAQERVYYRCCHGACIRPS